MFRFPHPSVVLGKNFSVSLSETTRKILYPLLAVCFVDEGWYLSDYPDVEAQVKLGLLQSARDHYCQSGYFEGRAPFPVTVDEKWYLRNYPDVERAIRLGDVVSAQQHYVDSGYAEGRLAGAAVIDPKWYISVYPVATGRISKGLSESAEDDYFKFGYKEGLLPFCPQGWR
jgi:hypothetical protein